MPKRMKYERKAARLARANSTAPPSPEETTALAAQGIEVNRGNSDTQPLSSEGEREIQQTSQKLAAKGGLDDLKTSKSVRATQTAQIVAQNNPQPITVKPDTADMESWAQGNLEGQPRAKVRDQINDLIRNNPSQKIPGQGALSTRPGESFDDFRTSRLSAIRGAMQELAQDPTAKLGRTTHSQVIKLVKGWVANGTPDDFSVKAEAMSDNAEPPGSVARLYPTGKSGKWQTEEVNLSDTKPLESGIYLIRHGMTPWNTETHEKSAAGQDARSMIAKYTKSLDFGRVRATAQKAVKAGHLSDDDVGGVIDAALPSDDEAVGLPLHHLLAVASAAGPDRRSGYAPIVQKHFGDMSQLPEDDRGQLAAHLAEIGLA